jgi:hypothetical protein
MNPSNTPGGPARIATGSIVLHYRRADGQWRLDVERSFTAVLVDLAKPVSDQAMEQRADDYIRRLDALGDFASKAVRELESGVYETPEAFDAVMAARVKSLPRQAKVVVKPADRR